jgi:hypothetical protein
LDQIALMPPFSPPQQPNELNYGSGTSHINSVPLSTQETCVATSSPGVLFNSPALPNSSSPKIHSLEQSSPRGSLNQSIEPSNSCSPEEQIQHLQDQLHQKSRDLETLRKEFSERAAVQLEERLQSMIIFISMGLLKN